LTVTAAHKFLFDTDFAAGPKPKSAISLDEHARLLADAETRGYRNGFAAGEAEARAETARRLATAFEQASETLKTMAGGLAGIEARLEAEAVDVAVAAARKLAPALIAREPFAEIAALVADCFRQIVAAPHLAVRVNENLYASAREQLDQLARQAGFEGRIVLLSEPDIAEGDCRIEWADGGLVRVRADTESAIAEAVARFVAARQDTAHDSVKGEEQ
jgi:flagellar assembly protein FliH